MIIELADWSSPPPYVAEFVGRHNLVFHQERWLNCYERPRLKQAVILNKNREMIGCFVYYVFKKGPLNFAITPPFCPDTALFFVNPAESTVSRNSFTKELLGGVAEYFIEQNLSYINLNLPQEVNDIQPFQWKGFAARTRYTYHLDLGRTEEALWTNLSGEKRKSINKAGKDNLEIRATNDAALVYELVIKSLSRNSKSKNLTIIKNIVAAFCGSGNSITYAAFLNGVPLAATFCLISQNKAMYLFGGYDAERGHHGAGVSCMWKSILEAKARGLAIFDFEGSMDKNIERYFREFGPELVPYQCVEKIKPLTKLLLTFKGHHPL